MISWRPCFVQQLEFGFSQKSTRHEQSGENRTEVYQRISRHVQWAILQTRNEGSLFTQVWAFFISNVFMVKYMIFYQNAYSFHDLSWRQAYLSIYCTPFFLHRYTALVIDTLKSACEATARPTAILDRHGNSRKTHTTRVASTMESANPVN